jgi:3-oxoacyl-[acyl-carrier protein] reductase
MTAQRNTAPRGLAVVTGAAGGIGATVAGRLADEGHRVLLVDLSPRVAEVAADVGAAWAMADVTTPAGTTAILDAVEQDGGTVALLVNCAGITRDGRLTEMTDEQFAQVLAVNLAGPLALTEALGDRFVDGASVVNISSRSALGNIGQANYAASKAGLLGMTRALAQQWAPRVRVNAVAPGLIETPMTSAMPERVLAKLVDRIPQDRIGTPDDVASAVAFLASDDASYVTGQTLLVCGGRSVAT